MAGPLLEVLGAWSRAAPPFGRSLIWENTNPSLGSRSLFFEARVRNLVKSKRLRKKQENVTNTTMFSRKIDRFFRRRRLKEHLFARVVFSLLTKQIQIALYCCFEKSLSVDLANVWRVHRCGRQDYWKSNRKKMRHEWMKRGLFRACQSTIELRLSTKPTKRESIQLI